MRFCLTLFMFCLFSLHAPKAETFKISTADFPESHTIHKLLNEVYKTIGYETELVFRPAKRSLMDVNSGRFDAELARIIGTETEYPNLIRVDEPIYALSFSAIVKKNSKIWLSSWEELKKHSIGYPRGYRILDIRTRDLDAVQINNSAAISKMVQGGRFEIGIAITSDAIKLAKENSNIVVLKPPIESITLYHYIHVKHRRLAPAIKSNLIKLNDSGRAKEILYGPN